MQDRPEASALLDAIADFLLKEVLPAVRQSDTLSYKALVSWNMLGVVSREIKEGEGLLNAELKRLSDFLKEPTGMPATAREKMSLAGMLNAELAEQIRRERIGPENKVVLSLIKQGLLEKLQIANPRFGTD